MNRAGYTLAELLIALVLAALAIGIVTTGVQQSLAFERRIEAVRQDREGVTAALAALRSRLETAVPATAPTTTQQDTANRRIPRQQAQPMANAEIDSDRPAAPQSEDAAPVLFQGSASSLVFLAADPGYPARPGLYEYRLVVEPAGDETEPAVALTLSRRALPDLAAFGDGGEAQSWTLMTLAEPVTLSYASEAGRWQTDWRDQQDLPIRVRMEFGETSGQPPFIVALPALPEETEAEQRADGEVTQ
ncbi:MULTISPECIES: prepilin-type N-terminal cleavage/methylation domain-containing protein [Hyphobacterium]|uniref:Prepilin-type N-terminal cleavage/methylation domain-containing protein n=1 Tax=Hyphobacterium vulgare TaxID=1736751 RepID=A0ABV6ZVA6_9PROT